ncbi:MAG TPA: HEAT repeat domain-containing protein [Candidatus Binatia bacterium]|nr:HEAT repeat domain-containing protein [Candidatus Binatia bacterium]
MALATINSYLAQIDELVSRVVDPDDMQFRLRLETLVKNGGRETENAIAHYLTGTYVGISTRLNLVRMAGYIRKPAFLVPLTRVLELGEDDLLREAAVLSIAKYNDRRALDILTQALEKSKNKRLQEPLNQAIGTILKNNPFLAMLPRFLLGNKNRELFQITLKIFKKILDPVEAKNLLAYLYHGDPLVAEGSFEVLCFRGDESVFYFIAEYFREQGRLLLREAEYQTGSERLAALIASLHEYLKRHRGFYAQLHSDIAAMSDRAGDNDWGKPLAALRADLEAMTMTPDPH